MASKGRHTTSSSNAGDPCLYCSHRCIDLRSVSPPPTNNSLLRLPCWGYRPGASLLHILSWKIEAQAQTPAAARLPPTGAFRRLWQFRKIQRPAILRCLLQHAQSLDALLDLLHHSAVGRCINSTEALLELHLRHEFGQIRPQRHKILLLEP